MIKSDKEFLEYYRTHLQGHFYCYEKEVEDEYHYERKDKGYDHLGSLGYENVKVIDSYKTITKQEKITSFNVIKVLLNLEKRKGYIQYDLRKLPDGQVFQVVNGNWIGQIKDIDGVRWIINSQNRMRLTDDYALANQVKLLGGMMVESIK